MLHIKWHTLYVFIQIHICLCIGTRLDQVGVYLDLEVLYNLGRRRGVRCVADAGTNDKAQASEHSRNMLEWYRKIWRAHTCRHAWHHNELAVLSILWVGSWTWALHIRLYIHHMSAGRTAESSLLYGWYIPTIERYTNHHFSPTNARPVKIFATFHSDSPWREKTSVASHGGQGDVRCWQTFSLSWTIQESWTLTKGWQWYLHCIIATVSQYLSIFQLLSSIFYLQPRVPNISGIVGRHRNILFAPSIGDNNLQSMKPLDGQTITLCLNRVQLVNF